MKIQKRLKMQKPTRREDILDFNRGILAELSLSDVWDEEFKLEIDLSEKIEKIPWDKDGLPF